MTGAGILIIGDNFVVKWIKTKVHVSWPIQMISAIPKPTTRTSTTTVALTTTHILTSHADEPTSDVMNTPTQGIPKPQNGGLSTGIFMDYSLSNIKTDTIQYRRF